MRSAKRRGGLRSRARTVAFIVVCGAALITAAAVGRRYFTSKPAADLRDAKLRDPNPLQDSPTPGPEASGEAHSQAERINSGNAPSPVLESRPASNAEQVPIRNQFRQARSWQERENVLLSIPKDSLVFHQEFLFEIAEGRDVDAVRHRAVDLLREYGIRSPSAYGLSIRMSRRLSAEPRPVIRKTLIDAMEKFYLAHRQESAFLVDVFARALTQDTDSGVRRRAALAVGWELEPDRALPILRAALKTEKNQEVLKEIRTGIELQEEEKRKQQ